MSATFVRWLIAFVITQAVECPIYVRAFKIRLWVAFGASAITHPLVVFVFPMIWQRIYLFALMRHPSWRLETTPYFIGYGILAETFAVLFEALWIGKLSKLPWRRALLISLVTNAASGFVGLICSALTGYP